MGKRTIPGKPATITLILMSGSLGMTPPAKRYAMDGQEQEQPPFDWPNGAKAAISLTFDDGRTSQVDYGIPLFDKHGIKATFYVNPGNIESRIDKWEAAAANGHEMGNHTATHPCSGNFIFSRNNALEAYSLQDMAEELDSASEALETLFGTRPTSFAYPCGQSYVGRGVNRASYVPLVAKRFLSGRGWMDEAPNDPSYCDFAMLTGMECDGRDFQYIQKLIDQTVEMGGWLVLAGHEILPESEHRKQSTYTEMLETLCVFLKDPANGLWVAPVRDVAAYVRKERGEAAMEGS